LGGDDRDEVACAVVDAEVDSYDGRAGTMVHRSAKMGNLRKQVGLVV
jgi:hypothetical protein